MELTHLRYFAAQRPDIHLRTAVAYSQRANELLATSDFDFWILPCATIEKTEKQAFAYGKRLFSFWRQSQ